MNRPLLEVEGLEVVYGHVVRAIQGVSFTVPEGSIVGIIGLNGAGKTTTIRAISGFMPTENVHVTHGRITFDGRSIVGLRPYETARMGIAVVPERDKLFDTLTVQENLELAVSVTPAVGGGRAMFGTIDDVYLEFPQLAKRRHSDAVYLSGGERQILAIVSSMLNRPRLLIVDEASLGLAPRVRRQVLDLLVRLNLELGLTVLIVDQDVAGVLSIAKHGYVLENGQVVFDGSSEALLAHGDVREFYLGAGDTGDSYQNVKQYRRVRRWY